VRRQESLLTGLMSGLRDAGRSCFSSRFTGTGVASYRADGPLLKRVVAIPASARGLYS
jgi:hypothetical protein